MSNADIKKIADAFNARPERERQLTLLVVLILIITAWVYLFFLPLNSAIEVLSMPISTTNNVLQKANLEYDLLLTTEQNPPTVALKQKEAALLAKLAKLSEDPSYSKKIIAPSEKIRSLLHIILVTEPGITLDRLEEDAKTNKIKLEFHGDYFATMHFFQRLENLPWYIFYEDFNYKVDLYPVANIRLTINTPSP